MTCKEVTDFLSDYLDGALPIGQRMRFWSHLLLCSHCRSYLKTFQASLNLAKSSAMRDLKDPPSVPEELVQAILRSKEPRS